MIVLPILSTSPIHFSLGRLGECTFWTWEWKGLPGVSNQCNLQASHEQVKSSSCKIKFVWHISSSGKSHPSQWKRLLHSSDWVVLDCGSIVPTAGHSVTDKPLLSGLLGLASSEQSPHLFQWTMLGEGRIIFLRPQMLHSWRGRVSGNSSVHSLGLCFAIFLQISKRELIEGMIETFNLFTPNLKNSPNLSKRNV